MKRPWASKLAHRLGRARGTAGVSLGVSDAYPSAFARAYVALAVVRPAFRAATGVFRQTLLEQTGLPYIIENVPDARHELVRPIALCGEWFGLNVQRHRFFESGGGFRLRPFVARCRHVRLLPFEHKQERAYADAMGCDWMSSHEAREAIPPAYTEWIGAQLLAHLRAPAAFAAAGRDTP